MTTPFWTLDCISIPAGARGVFWEYRVPPDVAWNRIGFTTETIWKVAEKTTRAAIARVRVVRSDGMVQARGIEVQIPERRLTPSIDRPALAGVAFPEPEVRQEGTALKIKPKVPDGTAAEEVSIEVRHGDESTAEASEAVHVGVVRATEEASEFAWPEAAVQTIFTRPIRDVDDQIGAWTKTTVDVVDPTQADDDRVLDDMSNLTLEPVGSVAVLEVTGGGDLQFRSMFIANWTTEIATLDELEIAQMHEKVGVAIATLAEEDLGEIKTFEVAFRPEVATQVRPDLYIADWTWPINPGNTDASGGYADHGIQERGLEVSGDKTPVRAELEVATSAASAGALGSYRRVVPGALIVARRRRFRVRLYSYFGKQVTISRMLIRPICRPAICCCDDVCCCWTKPKVLHDAVVASGGPTTLYTVPAGFCAEIDSFIVQETGAAALTFSGYYDPNAVGVGTATILDKDIALAADGRHELVGAKPLPLGAGGVLAIQTNTANARVVIVGRLAPI